jgi:hypothetical protein
VVEDGGTYQKGLFRRYFYPERMRDICKPLLSKECLVVDAVGVVMIASTRGGALEIIDIVTDDHGVVCDVFDLNRCSYGSWQRVRVSEMRLRSGWSEPVNVNVKNTALSFSFAPLNACQPVPGKCTAQPDALVPCFYHSCVWLGVATGAIAANLPANRRVYNLVYLRIIYYNALCIQLCERKKENSEKGRESRECRHSEQ